MLFTIPIKSLLLSSSFGQSSFMCLYLLVICVSGFFFLFFLFLLIFLIFFINILSLLYSLIAVWNCMEAVNSLLRAFTSYYHTLIVEFAKELLVAKEYQFQNSSFWVNSRLVDNKTTQYETFATVHTAIYDPDGLFFKKLCKTSLSHISILFLLSMLLLSLLTMTTLSLKSWVDTIVISLFVQLAASLISRSQPNQLSKREERAHSF